MNEHLSAFVGYLTDKEKSKSTLVVIGFYYR